MTVIYRLSIIFILTHLFTGCSEKNVFENYAVLPNNTWNLDSIKSFSFEIDDNNKTYDLLFTIKNGLDYSNYNIFVDYKLYQNQNGEEILIDKALKEFSLFHPKTGEPYGSGSSGWYSHAFLLIEQKNFETSGKYTLKLQQYMRIEELLEVANVGLTIKEHQVAE